MTGWSAAVPDKGDLRQDGGIFCPSCLMIHGRCHDALYPMMCLADRLKDETYLTAVKRLFRWGSNLLCDDGSYYNDAQNDWAGITVFSVIALEHALEFHSGLLTEEEKKEWEERLRVTADWVYRTITPQFDVNINYHAACAEALALTGNYFGRADYASRSDEMAEFCMNYSRKKACFSAKESRGMRGLLRAAGLWISAITWRKAWPHSYPTAESERRKACKTK